MSEQGEEFRWSAETVVVNAVQAVAVYFNPDGDVVIRQQDSVGNEDSFIVIPLQHAGKVAKAINALVRESKR